MSTRRTHTPAISALRTSRFTRFFVVPLTLLALFSGCYKWTTLGEPGTPRTSWDRTNRIRVTYHAEAAGYERTVLLERASVIGDSLIGGVPTGERVGASGVQKVRPQRLAIPLADITLIEERQGSTNTAGLVVGGVLATAAMVGLVFALKSAMEDSLDFTGMELPWPYSESVAPKRP